MCWRFAQPNLRKAKVDCHRVEVRGLKIVETFCGFALVVAAAVAAVAAAAVVGVVWRDVDLQK